MVASAAARRQKSAKRADDDNLSDTGFEITCARCGSVRQVVAVGSYCSCKGCVKPTLPEISAQEHERIPIGLMSVDAGGKVLDHEHPKCRPLVGRNLFTSVGCFAGVEDLSGWFREFLEGGESHQIFSLPFRLSDDELHVQILFWRVGAELALIRIWSVKAPPG